MHKHVPQVSPRASYLLKDCAMDPRAKGALEVPDLHQYDTTQRTTRVSNRVTEKRLPIGEIIDDSHFTLADQRFGGAITVPSERCGSDDDGCQRKAGVRQDLREPRHLLLRAAVCCYPQM